MISGGNETTVKNGMKAVYCADLTDPSKKTFCEKGIESRYDAICPTVAVDKQNDCGDDFSDFHEKFMEKDCKNDSDCFVNAVGSEDNTIYKMKIERFGREMVAKYLSRDIVAAPAAVAPAPAASPDLAPTPATVAPAPAASPDLAPAPAAGASAPGASQVPSPISTTIPRSFALSISTGLGTDTGVSYTEESIDGFSPASDDLNGEAPSMILAELEYFLDPRTQSSGDSRYYSWGFSGLLSRIKAQGESAQDDQSPGWRKKVSLFGRVNYPIPSSTYAYFGASLDLHWTGSYPWAATKPNEDDAVNVLQGSIGMAPLLLWGGTLQAGLRVPLFEGLNNGSKVYLSAQIAASAAATFGEQNLDCPGESKCEGLNNDEIRRSWGIMTPDLSAYLGVTYAF